MGAFHPAFGGGRSGSGETLPDQSGQENKYLRTDGTDAYWDELEIPEPVMETLSAQNITGVGADLRVDIEAFGLIKDLRIAFDYKETGAASWTRTTPEPVTALGVVTKSISGLNPDTGHTYRPVATDSLNPDVEVFGDEASFSTLDIYVESPTITSPADNATDIGETPEITTSAFSLNTGSGTHTRTRINLYDSSDELIEAFIIDDGDLTTFTMPAGKLDEGEVTYKLDAEHEDDVYGWSAKGARISFTTAEVFYETDTPEVDISEYSIGDALAGGFYGARIWDGVTGSGLLTSATELTIGTGEKSFTVNGDPHGLWEGRIIRLVVQGRNRSNAAWMEGEVISNNGTNISLSVTSVQGSGTFSDWAIVGRVAIIVAPKSWGDVGTYAWKDENTAGPVETQTLTNCRAATDAMIAGGATTYPAAAQVAAMNSYDEGNGRAGYNDWVIPSRDALQAVGYNLCPTDGGWDRDSARDADVTYSRDGNIDDATDFTEQTNWHSDPAVTTSAAVPQTSLTAWQDGGTEAFEATFYWSASEYASTGAWGQVFNGGAQNDVSKTYTYRVRAVRRLAI